MGDELNPEDEKQLSLAKRLINAFTEANIKLQERSDIFKGSYNSQAKEYGLIKDINKELKKSTQERYKLYEVQRSLLHGDIDSRDLLKSQEQIQKRINRLNVDKDLAKHISLTGTKEERRLFEDITAEIQESIKELDMMNSALGKAQEQSKGIEQTFGVNFFKNASEMVKKIGVNEDFAKPFEDAYDAARSTRFEQDMSDTAAKSAAEERAKISKEPEKMTLKSGKQIERFRHLETGKFVSGDKVKGLNKAMKAAPGGFMKAFGKGFMTLIKGLGKAIIKALGPVTVILAFVKALMKVDTELVEMSKSLNMSKQEAGSLRNEMTSIANQSGDIFVTTSKLIKAQNALNKHFGTAAVFTGDILVKATQILEKVKLTAEATAGLAGQSIVVGGSFEDNYENALGISYEIQRGTGISVDLRRVMEQVGKTTGSLRAQLNGSTTEIAEAVTNAEVLGMHLQTAANAGRQLLDFESSISNELEAELFTGKQLNLERARAAALTGDQVTLQNELAANMGTFSEFSEMNVLQQDALAKAMGMNSDALSDILFKQEIQGKTARELRALGKDELADRLEATTAQDKFNAMMTKLQSIIADIVTPLIPLLDAVGSIFELIGPIIGLLDPIITGLMVLVTGIVDTVGLLFGGDFTATQESASTFGQSLGSWGIKDPFEVDDFNLETHPMDTINIDNDNNVVTGGTNLKGGGMSKDEYIAANKELENTKQKTNIIIRDRDGNYADNSPLNLQGNDYNVKYEVNLL